MPTNVSVGVTGCTISVAGVGADSQVTEFFTFIWYVVPPKSGLLVLAVW